MNIAIDVSPLETGHNGRGVGVYTKLLIESLQMYHKEHTYTFFTHLHDLTDAVDLVHYPYFDPYFLTLPVIKRFPTVVTIHDLIPRKFPQHFPSGVKGYLKWQMQKITLKSVRRIITDSNCSKMDISEITHISPDKIDVIYLAPTIPDPKKSASDFKRVLNKYGIEREYLLYVGDVNWNKNIEGLLRAFSIVLKTHPNTQLVFVGRSFLNSNLTEMKRIYAVIAELKLEKSIVNTGYVDNEEIARLYERAICLVQPSYYEGFGLPVIDALSHRCAVVASDASSLPEVSGPSVQVNSKSAQSVADGIQRVMKYSAKERNTQLDKGQEWAKRFTWEKVAQQSVDSYTHSLP